MSRQYRCIELTPTQLLSVREVIRPFHTTNNVLETIIIIDFCKKLYMAYIQLQTKELKEINIAMSEDECLLVNQFIGAEDFEGSLDILRQTWSVLYELENEVPPQYESMSAEMLELVRGDENAEGNSP